MITLHLARHGNTFTAAQTPVYAGCRNDVPLVAEGEAQAQRFAAFLAKRALLPTALLHSQLQRTRRFAEIIAAQTGLTLHEDARLNEIDYGAWTGQTVAAIHAQFGAAAHTAWEEHGTWPPVPAQWAESEAQARTRVYAFLEDVAAGRFGSAPLAVTSQGILRVMLTADAEAWHHHHTNGSHKVKTSHYSCLIKKDGWRVTDWNQALES